MTQNKLVGSLLLQEIKRRLLGECFPRMHRCLDMMSEDQIWYRPNEESNSLGNLVLHLAGNLRQWLGSTLGGKQDNRQRQQEFDQREQLTRSELKSILLEVESEMEEILEQVTDDDLLKEYYVQGYTENGTAILVHVTEHFSYHVGQATYIAKMLTGRPTDYYAGQDLDQTSTEGDAV